MSSFGEKLKLEREKRKITLEQISASTKIGTRMLQALEEDKFSQLPGGIFNKGFVRAYARFVGLDEDQTVADYMQASGDAPPAPVEIEAREDREDTDRARAENVSRLEATSDEPSRPLPWGWFAAGLLIVALALSLWSHNRREHSKPPRSGPTTVSAPGSAASSDSAVQDTSSLTANHDHAAADAPSSRPSLQPALTSGTVASVPKTTQEPPTQTPLAPGEFAVLIQAREESWLSVTADGRPHSSELLAPGSERAFRGRKEIVVKVGNAGGVDLRFNGKKLDTGGDFGEVKTITIGPGGLVPNAPAQVSTP